MPSEVVEKARKHGINISKVSENVLIDMINRIKGSEKKEDPAFSVKAFPKRFEWAGWESNPRSPPRKGGIITTRLPAQGVENIF